MTRIIAGSAGGRLIRVPEGNATRPSSDRAREGLFSRLDYLTDIPGARVLDLYAGSGALGLECSSRGATSVTCVEMSRSAAAVAHRNARDLGMDHVHVVTAKAETWLALPRDGAAYDIVLLDPPYAAPEDEVSRVLDLLAAGWVEPESVVVVERSRRSPEPRWPSGWRGLEPRSYGETVVWFAETAPAQPPASVGS